MKCRSKLRYMSHKIFDNNLVVIQKIKVLLKLVMYKIETEDVDGDFSSDKEMFDFRNYQNIMIIQTN